jgi:hypothetical protein
VSFFRPDATPTARSKAFSQLAKPTFTSNAGGKSDDAYPKGYRESGERDFWEAPSIGDRAERDGEGLGQHMQTVMTGPATILETPISTMDWAVNQVLQPSGPPEPGAASSKGPIEGFGEFVRDIPFVGDVAEKAVNVLGDIDVVPGEGEFKVGLSPLGDFAGEALMHIDNAVTAPMNSRFARAVKAIDRNGEGELIDRNNIAKDIDFVKGILTTVVGLGSGDWEASLPDWVQTGTDYKKYLNDAFGFTYELQDKVVSGEITSFDLGTDSGVTTASDPATDMFFRIGANPTNVAFLGAGAATRALPQGLKIAMATARSSKAITTVPAVSTRLSPTVMTTAKAGKGFEGITYEGFGAWGLKAASVAGKAGRGYVKGSIGLTAAMLASNVIEEHTDIPMLDGLQSAFRAISEKRPLSNNEAFILTSMFFIPSPHGAAALAKRVKARARRPGTPITGRDITAVEKALINQLADGMPELQGKSFAQRQKAIRAQYGSDAVDGYVFQMIRGAEEYGLNLRNLRGDPAGLRHYDTRTAHGAAIRTELDFSIERLTEKLANGTISPQLAKEAAESMYFTGGNASGGAFSEAVGGGTRGGVFDGHRAMSNYKRYAEVAHEIERMGGLNGYAPKLRLDYVSTEFIDDVVRNLEIYKADGLTLSKSQVNDMLFVEEAIFAADYAGAGKLAKYRTRDTGPVVIDDLIEELRELQAEGTKQGTVVSIREIAAPERTWAADARRTARGTAEFNSKLRKDGTLRDNMGPRDGVEVRLTSQALPDRIGPTIGYDAETIGAARANPKVRAVETELPVIFDQAGYAIDDVAQITQVKGKTVQPATSYRFAGDVAPQQALEVAALGLKNGPKGVPSSMVVSRGKQILEAFGLSRNAMQYEWKMASRLSPTEYKQLVNQLRSQFGDAVQVTDRVVTVTVRANATGRIVNKLDTYLNKTSKATKADYTAHPVHVTEVVKKRLKKHAGDPDVVTIAEVEANARRGFSEGRRYAHAESRFASLEGRAVPADDFLTDAGLPPRYRTGQRGTEGSPGGGTAAENRGSGGFRETGAVTDYEAGRWGHARGRTTEYVVGDAERGAALGRYRAGRVEQLGEEAALGLQFPTGSTVRAIRGGHAGSIVTAGGELRLWRNTGSAGRSTTREFGDLLAESAEHASWTAVEYGSAAGKRTITELGQHGFRPLGRTRGDSPVVFMFRDVAGETRLPAVPPKQQGGIKALYEDIPEMTPASGVTNARALEELYHPPGSAARIEVVESAAMDLYAMNELSALETLAKSAPTDAAVTRALEMGRANPQGAGFGARPGTDPFPLSARAELEGAIEPQLITFIRKSEQQMSDFIPNLDRSILDNRAGLPASELRKINNLERAIQKIDPNYTLGKLPRGGTPWTATQGQTYRQMVGGKQAMETFFDKTLGNQLTSFTDFWRNPVFSRTMSSLTKAEVGNQFLNHGATQKQVNRFTRKVGKYYDAELSGIFGTDILKKQAGVRRYRNPQAIPKEKIEQFANEVFGPEVMSSIAKGGDNAAAMLSRSASRWYRGLSKKYPAVDGKGSLNGMVEELYGRGNMNTTRGKLGGFSRGAIDQTKGVYHWMRFLADPRWFALNWFEAEILGITRAGWRAGRKSNRETYINKSGQREFKNKSDAVEGLADNRDFIGQELKDAGDFNPGTRHDATSAGQMDPRSVGGFRNSMFDVEAPELIANLVRDEFALRPEFQSLMKKYGGTPTSMADDFLTQIGRFDQKGVRATYMEELGKLGYTPAEQRLMRECVDAAVPQAQDLFKDITHVFHGNVNRSNLERLMNNPLLWWPISYQLKVYKNLADFMFKRQFGREQSWGGTAMLYALTQGHEYFTENDEEYRKFFEDHPDTWQLASMMLPVAPWEDVGAYMSRPGRFATNWAGAHLGVTGRDPNYPTNPVNFAIKSMQVGPFFSYGVAQDMADEWGYELPDL